MSHVDRPVIRCYQPTDETALIELWRQVLPDPAPHNDSATSLRNKLALDDGLILVATAGDRIVGAVMGGYDGHRGWIYSLAVAQSHRRQGVGAALVRQMEAMLKQRGCLKLNLQVRASNAEVLGFYQSVGFKVEPNISMGKRLY